MVDSAERSWVSPTPASLRVGHMAWRWAQHWFELRLSANPPTFASALHSLLMPAFSIALRKDAEDYYFMLQSAVWGVPALRAAMVTEIGGDEGRFWQVDAAGRPVVVHITDPDDWDIYPAVAVSPASAARAGVHGGSHGILWRQSSRQESLLHWALSHKNALTKRDATA